MNGNHPWIRWMRQNGILPKSWSNETDRNQAVYIRAMMKDIKNRVQLDTPLGAIRYLVFDLETTGFRPWRGDEILSIGAVPVEQSQVIYDRLFYSLVKPQGHIPQSISELTGITEEVVHQEPSIDKVLGKWLKQVQGTTLVAYGAKHDFSFVQAFMSKCFGQKISNRIIDLYQIIRWMHPDWLNHSLDQAIKMYQIPARTRHTADGDALMTAELWMKVLVDLRERGLSTLGDLYEALGKDQLV